MFFTGSGHIHSISYSAFLCKKYTMKEIHTLTYILLLFALIPASNAYWQKKEKPCYVTYQVSTHDQHPHKLLISYQTENSLESSIFVQDIFAPESSFIYLENKKDSSSREWDIAPISVRILGKNQTKLAPGYKFPRLQL